MYLLLAVFRYNARAMHAFLFTGATELIRQQKIKDRIGQWNISPFDTIFIQQAEEHITIDSVRSLKKQLMLAPMKSEFIAGVIYQAKSMTTEAQNALLKLLEEPPPRVRILLETDAADMLLPTIVSRCEVIRIAADQTARIDIPLLALLDAPIGERLAKMEEYGKDRINAKAFVEESLATGERLLHTHENKTLIASLLRKLLTAQKQLHVNCNPKLVLDRAFFL